MSPHTASNAAGLILLPFFVICALQLGCWLAEWLAVCLTGWL